MGFCLQRVQNYWYGLKNYGAPKHTQLRATAFAPFYNKLQNFQVMPEPECHCHVLQMMQMSYVIGRR